MGTRLTPLLKGHSPQFSAHVRCGQTAGWTKMPLDTEVNVGPGDFVFDGDPAIPVKNGTPSTMRPGPRPTFLPSAILIHPAVRPQQTWAENWEGLCSLFGDEGRLVGWLGFNGTFNTE